MLLFDGLHCFGRGSICRVRVVSAGSEGSRAVLATHLQDSPGPSIANDVEGLVASVSSDFGEQPTRWLLHFPDAEAATWTEAKVAGREVEWNGLSRGEAEAITGLDLSGADTEPASIIELAGDHGLLLAMAVVPEQERLPAACLAAVPVPLLPFPHHPFRCPHAQRFADLAGTYDEAPPTVVGAHWYLTLSAEDFEECPFHQADWLAVAEASVAILEALPAEASNEEVIDSCAESALAGEEMRWLRSLFSEPIVWIPGEQELTNGQHRTCALRAAGAERCVVETDGHPLPSRFPRDGRAAAHAALACHWLGRAAEGSPGV